MYTVAGIRAELPPSLLKALAVYRYQVFVERLGWPLPARDGLEIDSYDRPDTGYVIGQDGEGAITGCARLLPTDRSYMLRDVFPQLMGDEPLPRTRWIWELSRFAVTSTGPSRRSLTGVEENTRTLIGAAVKWAAERGARRLITVSPLGVERLLRRLGVNARRAGPLITIDGRPTFACWIELDARTMVALGVAATPGRRRSASS